MPNASVFRALVATDIPSILQIQQDCYPPHLREEEHVFLNRLQLRPHYCLAACMGPKMVGYIIAHGWRRMSPPELGAELQSPVTSEILYIHDLAIGKAGRGQGLGERLVDEVIFKAAMDGLATAELVAVSGAAPYWQNLGFTETPPSPTIQEKLRHYGTDARWMTRRLQP